MRTMIIAACLALAACASGPSDHEVCSTYPPAEYWPCMQYLQADRNAQAARLSSAMSSAAASMQPRTVYCNQFGCF